VQHTFQKTLVALVERERKVLRQIAAGEPLSQVLSELLTAVEAEHGNGMLTSILLMSDDGQSLRHGAAPSLPSAYNEAVDGIAVAEGVGSCGTAAARGAPVYVSDISVDPLWQDFRDLASTHNLHACWSTPIRATGDEILGTFAVYYDAPRSATREDIDAIAFVTQTAALAIERHRSDDVLRRSWASLEDVNSALEYANRRLSAQVSETSKDLERSWRLSQGLLVTALPDGTIDSINPRWTQLLGWGPNEIVGKQFIEFTHPDDLERTLQVFASIFDGPLVTPYEYRFRHKDGSYRWFAWTAAFEEGKVYASGRQTTTEREQAEALRQSQKMEAVGQLTGGLAHDFNNLLAGISGSLELMQIRMQQGRMTDVDRYLTAAQSAAKRAASLTHRLLAFSRRQTLEPRPTDVNRLVAGMQELVQRTVGPAISVETVGVTDCWPALVDAPQLENALLNLCLNARDAMLEGGNITIETANRWMDERAARLHQLSEGQYVSLCVTDTGFGMPRDVIDRAFEPSSRRSRSGRGPVSACR
jgi:PAS domain S-box-containing protein